MAVITYDAEAPGKGAVRPVLAQSPRVMKVVTGKFDFDSSYPTGGEDIADIAAQFAGSVALGVVFEPVNAARYHIAVDYAAKKVKLFIEDATTGVEAEAANASDQSAITGVRWMAWGYA